MTLAAALSPTYYQDLFTSMSEALIFADAAGIICSWNSAAEALFGFTAAEAIGQSLDLIIPEPLRKAHWVGYHAAVERGMTRHAGSRVTKSLCKSGNPLYVDMSFAIVKNQAGEVTGSMAIARDFTARHLEKKQLQQQLAAAMEKPSA